MFIRRIRIHMFIWIQFYWSKISSKNKKLLYLSLNSTKVRYCKTHPRGQSNGQSQNYKYRWFFISCISASAILLTISAIIGQAIPTTNEYKKLRNEILAGVEELFDKQQRADAMGCLYKIEFIQNVLKQHDGNMMKEKEFFALIMVYVNSFCWRALLYGFISAKSRYRCTAGTQGSNRLYGEEAPREKKLSCFPKIAFPSKWNEILTPVISLEELL